MSRLHASSGGIWSDISRAGSEVFFCFSPNVSWDACIAQALEISDVILGSALLLNSLTKTNVKPYTKDVLM